MKTVKSRLAAEIRKTCYRLWPKLAGEKLEIEIEYPKEEKHGDYSTNICFQLAPLLGQSCLSIGNQIITSGLKIPGLIKAEVVPPGFINFYFDNTWLAKQINSVIDQAEDFGNSSSGRQKKVQVEFISANPTGPIHIGNGRGAFIGDTLCNVFAKLGYRVQREYYVNDIGNQVDNLAESVTRRYLQQQGISVDYPPYCYRGKYIDGLAKKLHLEKYKLTNVNLLKARIRYRALQVMIKEVKKVVTGKLKIKFDNWFSEKSLYRNGTVDQILDLLKRKGILYKDKKAIWAKTSLFGDEKDRVVVKASGDQTYFLSDIAYLWNKLNIRKFDKVIDIWGADHHGYVERMKAMAKALGYDGCFDVIIVQMVRLIEGEIEIKMSKRSGTYVTLEELVDEVGLDAARFFFLMYAADTHMDFDMTLAKKKSAKNPVYYVQYAHARICSIMKNVLKEAHKLQPKPSKKQKRIKIYLREKPEIKLAKTLIRLPEVLEGIASTYQVNKLPTYAQGLASDFHEFYTQCRVIESEGINESRLQLTKATQLVLAQTLKIMGIQAPSKM